MRWVGSMKSFHTTRVQTSDSKVKGPILCSYNTCPLNKSFFFFWGVYFSPNFMILKNMAQFSLIFSKISQIYKIFFKNIYIWVFLCQKITNNFSGKNKKSLVPTSLQGYLFGDQIQWAWIFSNPRTNESAGETKPWPFYWFVSHEFSEFGLISYASGD